ncbi:DUF4153 domain-containing protein [Chengkuizengella axinellae]|uniref:DUF4173 domain-containing protein n=1 Tax=Chengkuizengella axinellae TaxID=3064388 RepID=A0ABT9J1K0_9BACL|nr:DUF4173 domain-containing protein [Chengkuizengella sp. 2205SS18-9]MDP5275448.1 DUF4173 domain-containing protein [Chengkuizengella sp. 2205SS18-9]
MSSQIPRSDIRLLVACLLLGVLFELSFFHGTVGVSYILYVVAFYWLYYWRFRKFSLTNHRLGFLILICIWLLALSYLLFSSPFFYVVNGIVIPCLMIIHIVLITNENKIQWYRISFLYLIFKSIADSFSFLGQFFKVGKNSMLTNMDEGKIQMFKKIGLGLLISSPVLVIVISLLSSADQRFSHLINTLPNLMINVPMTEWILRTFVVIVYSLVVFGFIGSLRKSKSNEPSTPSTEEKKLLTLDSIIIATFLVVLDIVYVLFVSVQFQYFFSDSLHSGYTYAEYARRGFFELLLVSLINLSVLSGVLAFTKVDSKRMKQFIQILLSILIIASGIMLVSAFLRMNLYEEFYGYTLLRILPHSFMIFLGIVFAYTLVKVWIDRLTLRHFYFISALLYYTVLNVMNIDQIIVNENIKRFEQTGIIDVYYMSQSDPGIKALIDIFEKNPDDNELEIREVLLNRKNELSEKETSWQSFNFTKYSTEERLKSLNLD